MSIKIHKRIAKPISFGGKRSLEAIKYISIHYTGNKGDTAKNNADYFATGNTRQAGAHFYVDKKGEIWKSINMNRIAWSVGGFYGNGNGAGKYFRKCTNTNSISIELCDCVNGTNWEQMLSTRNLVQYIQKKCPNAKTIIRHWDVNGKSCPLPMIGTNNEKWTIFYTFITKGYSFDAKVTKNATIRSTPKVAPNNKVRNVKKGTKLHIVEMKENWGRLKKNFGDKTEQWINLNKVKEVKPA